VRISAADLEAELAAREALAAAREPVPAPATAPAPQTRDEPRGPALTVSTRIVDREWRALPGARVAWIERGADLRSLDVVVRREVRADASGAVWLALARAELDPAQALTLLASAPGHVRVQRTLAPAELAGSVLNLGEWVLVPGGDVTGRVVDARGQPLAGALVKLAPELGELTPAQREEARLWPLGGDVGVPGLVPVALTDADGRFTLAGMPAGRFDVVAATLASDPPRLPARSERIVVQPGATVEAGELVLADAAPEELITGIVLGADGAPFEGALVGLHTEHASLPVGTRTSAAGRFAHPAPRDAEFRVVARDPDERWAPAEVAGARAGGPEVELRFERPAPERSGDMEEPAPAPER
jgi:protocatechuate 3,4-dioxygenase beta subunit